MLGLGLAGSSRGFLRFDRVWDYSNLSSLGLSWRQQVGVIKASNYS